MPVDRETTARAADVVVANHPGLLGTRSARRKAMTALLQAFGALMQSCEVACRMRTEPALGAELLEVDVRMPNGAVFQLAVSEDAPCSIQLRAPDQAAIPLTAELRYHPHREVYVGPWSAQRDDFIGGLEHLVSRFYDFAELQEERDRVGTPLQRAH